MTQMFLCREFNSLILGLEVLYAKIIAFGFGFCVGCLV